LQQELKARLSQGFSQRVAPLAVWHFDDLECVEGLVAQRKEWQTGANRGPFPLLKLWDWEGGKAPAWWYFISQLYPNPPRSPTLDAAYEKWRASIPDSFRDCRIDAKRALDR
jgi:hypothetical protein